MLFLSLVFLIHDMRSKKTGPAYHHYAAHKQAEKVND